MIAVERKTLLQVLDALRDIVEGTRLNAAGNRNDDGLIDHDGKHNFKLRIKPARVAIEELQEILDYQTKGTPL